MRDGEGPDIKKYCTGCGCELDIFQGHLVASTIHSSILVPVDYSNELRKRNYTTNQMETYCDKCYEGVVGVFETKEDKEDFKLAEKLSHEEKQKIIFNYNNLLGKMGENLVENIFKSRFKIYHFGYELITENLAQLEIKPKVYTKAHSMVCVSPDFLFYSEEKGLFFVEVKTFRKYNLKEQLSYFGTSGRGYYKIRDVVKYYPQVLIINLIWNSEKPHIILYSGEIKFNQGREILEIKEEMLESLFSEKEKNRLMDLLKEVTPPNIPNEQEM